MILMLIFSKEKPVSGEKAFENHQNCPIVGCNYHRSTASPGFFVAPQKKRNNFEHFRV